MPGMDGDTFKQANTQEAGFYFGPHFSHGFLLQSLGVEFSYSVSHFCHDFRSSQYLHVGF